MNAWKAHIGLVAWPTLAMTAVLCLASVGTIGAALTDRIPLWVGTLVLTPLTYLWFTPLHEAVHGNIGGTRTRSWVDHVVGWTAAAYFAAPFPAFKLIHLRHHAATNRDGRDPDRWMASRNPLALTARALTILPYYYWMLFNDLMHETQGTKRDGRVTFLGLFLVFELFAVAVGAGVATELLALWLVPAWIASALLAVAFDWIPHQPHAETDRFQNARVICGRPWVTWLMVGQNYHLVHHLWPRVPFYAYGQVFAAQRAALERHDAPILDLAEPRPQPAAGLSA